ncbi:hypothetical protein F2Q69_00019719 [Brassica cretica]|uniref:Uncharacterized protein n=1 Tax=Brassica cretica TaxID=69181 RepID=A0A8S9QFE9_BRACR|nr:hypothetical protein F2Q69_00019719 [Brassica cretica]
MHGFVSYRRFGKARSLCNDRNVHVLGRYVAIELGSSSVKREVPTLRWARPPPKLWFRLPPLRWARPPPKLRFRLPPRAGAEFPSSYALAIAPDHGAEVQVPHNAGTLVDARVPCVPDALVHPAGSSTTPIFVEGKERAAESMPPPPARKEIVLALRAPSAAPVAQPKGRKRKFTKGGDGESSQQGGLNPASELRGKFMSLIDGMISECGARSLRSDRAWLELGRYIATKRDARSVKREVPTLRWARPPPKLRSRLPPLRRARPPPKLRFRLPPRAGAEFPSSSALAIAPDHGAEVQVPHNAGTLVDASVPCVPDALVHPAGSSTTTIFVEGKERAADSMPPPPARKEIVLALRAPSAAPVAQPKGRKRKFTKGGDGESSQQGGLNPASELRGKFMSLIDEMISECGSEASRLAGELTEMQGRWSETEAMLKAVKDSHSAKVSKLEVEIGELERNPGKTASSLLKEKKARKAKSSEVCRLQRQIESKEMGDEEA